MGDGRGNNRVVGRGCQADLKCPTRIQCWSLLGGGTPLCHRGSHLCQQPAGVFIIVTSSYNSKTE